MMRWPMVLVDCAASLVTRDKSVRKDRVLSTAGVAESFTAGSQTTVP
jgi:hypothetical protein